MANICDYEVRVKGSRNAGLMVFASMPCMDYKEISNKKKVGNSYLITFKGDTKWSVNYGVTDSMDRIDIESMDEDEIEEAGGDLWDYSLRAKSEAFNCEIMVHYWSGESEFDQFDHYVKGKCVKRLKIKFDYDNDGTEFDWDKLEFVGHEGEYDESVSGEEEDIKAINMLNSALTGQAAPKNDNAPSYDELMKAISNAENTLKELGINPDEVDSSDTDYMYNWTFKNGKTAKGDGWKIAVPDGFVSYDSHDGENRLFEFIPNNCQSYDLDDMPVHIMCGQKQNINNSDMWMVHPKANAGVGAIRGALMAETMARMLYACPVFSTGWDDVYAFVFMQKTGIGAYSFQVSVFTDDSFQTLRIQSGYCYGKEKELLNSCMNWLHTMKFNRKNSACPKTPIIDTAKCLNDLLAGKLTEFNKAVDQAQNEYTVCLNGRVKALQFAANNGIIEEYDADDVRQYLNDAMEVREFYLKKFNDFLNKKEVKELNALTLEKVYKKLHDLDKDVLNINLLNECVTISVPESVADIRNEWRSSEAQLKFQIKKCKDEEAKIKEKREAEAKVNFEKNYEKWTKSCDEIDKKRFEAVNAEFDKERKLKLEEKQDEIKTEIRRLSRKQNELEKDIEGYERNGFCRDETYEKLDGIVQAIYVLQLKLTCGYDSYEVMCESVPDVVSEIQNKYPYKKQPALVGVSTIDLNNKIIDVDKRNKDNKKELTKKLNELNYAYYEKAEEKYKDEVKRIDLEIEARKTEIKHPKKVLAIFIIACCLLILICFIISNITNSYTELKNGSLILLFAVPIFYIYYKNEYINNIKRNREIKHLENNKLEAEKYKKSLSEK